MEQVSTVMGALSNVVEGLATICQKLSPDLIGLPTTALSETQGSDIELALGQFRDKHPSYSHIPVIPVSTPDYSGCLETGFAAAVEAMIHHLVPAAEQAGTWPGRCGRQINVLPSAMLTPGDVQTLKGWCEAFGLVPLVLPDLSESLDGHLIDADHSPLSVGGVAVIDVATMGNAAATLVIGPSMYAAGDRLQARTGVPDYRVPHVMGLTATDRVLGILAEVSGKAVPHGLARQRSQLQDAMLDTHFYLGQTRVGVAADPDLLVAATQFFADSGAEVQVAVAPVNAVNLDQAQTDRVKIGDLEDFADLAENADIELLLGNSHVAQTAKALSRPILRIGYPLYDWFGGFDRVWIGYQGARQALYDLANLLAGLERGELHPYQSIYSQRRVPSTEQADDIIAAVASR